MSTLADYSMLNPLKKKLILFQTYQFSMSTQFNCLEDLYFKPFTLVKQF